MRLKAKLPHGSFRPAQEPVNDLSAVSSSGKVPALRWGVREEAEDEAALVGDPVVRLGAGRGVVRDDVRRGIATRHPDGGKRLEGTVLGYEHRMTADALNLRDDSPSDLAQTHGRSS